MGGFVSSYDKRPYRSYPYAVSAAEHISALAFLLGYDPPLASSSRVLEIGCAAGNNLIPFAMRNPRSECVGIDISAVQITMAKRSREALELDNIEFIDADFQDFVRTGPPFDFIVCHGVLSWISPGSQTALLHFCRDHLAAHGVAYISYNCYPGWKSREVLRDAMLLRVAAARTDNDVGIARGMVEFLAHHVDPDSPTGRTLARDASMIAQADDGYLAHDFLEAENRPLYLNDFAAACRDQGLRYFFDSRMSVSSPSAYSSEIITPLLYEAGNDPVLLEQFVDFVVERQFRQSLIIPGATVATAGPFTTVRLAACHFAAADKSGDTATPIERLLSERYPKTVSFADVRDHLLPEEAKDDESVARQLLALLERERIRVRREPIATQARPGLAPSWKTFAGLTVEQGRPFLVNAYHEPVLLDPVEACLIEIIADGPDRSACIEHLLASCAGGRLQFLVDGTPVNDSEKRREVARDHAQRSMATLNAKLSGLT